MEKRWWRIFHWSLSLFVVNGLFLILMRKTDGVGAIRPWLFVSAVIFNLTTVGWYLAIHKTCPVRISSRWWRRVHLAVSCLVLPLAFPLPYALIYHGFGHLDLKNLAIISTLIFVAYIFAFLSWSLRQQSQQLRDLDQKQAKLVADMLTKTEDARVSIRILRGDEKLN